jgi:hypothetical protein
MLLTATCDQAVTACALEPPSWPLPDGPGRGARAQIRTAPGGVIYAVTRHATSRAGDPSPHDHVMVANIVDQDIYPAHRAAAG